MKYLISIDGSTSNTGLAVFQIKKDGIKEYIAHFLFTAPKHKYTPKKEMTKTKYKSIHTKEKLQFMKENVNFMIKNIFSVINFKYKPSSIVIEDTYGGNDPYTLKYLSRLQGAIEGYCITNDIPIKYKTPSEWRKDLGLPNSDGKTMLKRPALKANSVKYVKDHLDLDVSDDEADAICLGLSENP